MASLPESARATRPASTPASGPTSPASTSLCPSDAQAPQHNSQTSNGTLERIVVEIAMRRPPWPARLRPARRDRPAHAPALAPGGRSLSRLVPRGSRAPATGPAPKRPQLFSFDGASPNRPGCLGPAVHQGKALVPVLALFPPPRDCRYFARAAQAVESQRTAAKKPPCVDGTAQCLHSPKTMMIELWMCAVGGLGLASASAWLSGYFRPARDSSTGTRPRRSSTASIRIQRSQLCGAH